MMRCGTELALKEKMTSLLSPHTTDIKSRAMTSTENKVFLPFLLAKLSTRKTQAYLWPAVLEDVHHPASITLFYAC